ADAKKVAAPLIEAIEKDTAEGGVDEIHIVFTEFVSMMTQTALDDRLLPLSLEEVAAEATPKGEILPLYDFEPSAEDVLDALLPRYVESRIYNALLQSAASKHAATRRAMKSATDNAGDLITSLSRLANAARQAEITQEISEIVGGSAALADATAGSDR
ncbi:MAG: F0F1 ATP synthase subunit gamma, partial [Streptomyces sp.]|nr:F0F1 ATP synthase subunit gamma [Streptomyces sp.]